VLIQIKNGSLQGNRLPLRQSEDLVDFTEPSGRRIPKLTKADPIGARLRVSCLT
jgi:hypothetical protein